LRVCGQQKWIVGHAIHFFHFCHFNHGRVVPSMCCTIPLIGRVVKIQDEMLKQPLLFSFALLFSFVDADNDGWDPVVLQAIILACGLWFLSLRHRNPSFEDQPLSWNNICEKDRRRGDFRRYLRMSEESFDKLLGYIRHDLEVNETMANLRGGTIIPEVCLFYTLRYLAGGSYLDITEIAGISGASFSRVLWNTCKAICKCDE
jgi:hypothetical protein